jgi:hypothetical protein
MGEVGVAGAQGESSTITDLTSFAADGSSRTRPFLPTLPFAASLYFWPRWRVFPSHDALVAADLYLYVTWTRSSNV